LNVVDFNNPPAHHKLTASVEREETPSERNVRLFKDVALFLVAIGFVVLIALLCYNTLISETSTADGKKWAMSVLSASTGGLIGYLVRK
jgi:hypothetical protein